MINKLTGSYLKEYRLSKGVSRKELAKKLKMSWRTLEGWEQGRFSIRPILHGYILDILVSLSSKPQKSYLEYEEEERKERQCKRDE